MSANTGGSCKYGIKCLASASSSTSTLYKKELAKELPLAPIHIAETRRFDGSLIPSQNCQLEWMIYCRGPICLGQGYNMPRKRGSNAISQNYPGVRRGGRGVEDVIRYSCCCHCSLHPWEKCKEWDAKYWESTVFNVNIRRVHHSLSRADQKIFRER